MALVHDGNSYIVAHHQITDLCPKCLKKKPLFPTTKIVILIPLPKKEQSETKLFSDVAIFLLLRSRNRVFQRQEMKGTVGVGFGQTVFLLFTAVKRNLARYA